MGTTGSAHGYDCEDLARSPRSVDKFGPAWSETCPHFVQGIYSVRTRECPGFVITSCDVFTINHTNPCANHAVVRDAQGVNSQTQSRKPIYVTITAAGDVRQKEVLIPYDIKVASQTGQLRESAKCESHHPQQVILLTYARSGSSLTADIIQKQTNVFIYYEPLHDLAKTFSAQQSMYEKENKKYLFLTSIPEYLTQAERIVEQLMTCDYKNLPKVASENLHNRLYSSTAGLLKCMKAAETESSRDRCLQEGETRCKEKQVHFLKIIRLPISAVGHLMDKHPCLKMIYLVRDPRGSFLSKKKTFNFIRANATYEAIKHCYRRTVDANAALQLLKQYPARVHITRYETIAERPIETSRGLYQFLGLDLTDDISQYIRSKTSAGKDQEDAYALAKADSKRASYAWRTNIPYSDVQEFDKYCADVYDKLGYLPARTEEELRSLEYPLKFDKDYLE